MGSRPSAHRPIGLAFVAPHRPSRATELLCGLTLALARRMKHTYPRAIRLALSGRLDLGSTITHRFPLERGREAFAVAARREGDRGARI